MDKIKLVLKWIITPVGEQVNVVQNVTVITNGINIIYERDLAKGDYYQPGYPQGGRLSDLDLIKKLKDEVTDKTIFEMHNNDDVIVTLKNKGKFEVREKINNCFGITYNRFVMFGDCYPVQEGAEVSKILSPGKEFGYKEQVKLEKLLKLNLGFSAQGLSAVGFDDMMVRYFTNNPNISFTEAQTQNKERHDTSMFAHKEGDIAFIMGSTNDVMTLGSYAGQNFPTTKFVKSIEDAIDNLRSKDKNMAIFMVLPPIVSDPNSKFYKSADKNFVSTPEDFKEMNDLLRKIATEKGLNIIEIKEDIATRGGDGWHYENNGYRKMLKFIVNEACEKLHIKEHPLKTLVNDPSFGFNEGLQRESIEAIKGICFEKNGGKKDDLELNNYLSQFLANKNSEKSIS